MTYEIVKQIVLELFQGTIKAPAPLNQGGRLQVRMPIVGQ